MGTHCQNPPNSFFQHLAAPSSFTTTNTGHNCSLLFSSLALWQAKGNSFLFLFSHFGLLLMVHTQYSFCVSFKMNSLFESTACISTHIFFSYQFGKLIFCHMIQMLFLNQLLNSYFYHKDDTFHHSKKFLGVVNQFLLTPCAHTSLTLTVF